MIQPENNKGINDLCYRNLIDLLPCYICVLDRELRILFNNHTFKNDFGDGTGRNCHIVYKESENKCSSCPVQKSFEDKKIHISEETVQLSDGNINQMIVYSVPIPDVFGNVKTVMEMSVNINKIKEIQSELVLLGQSVAILSHDIKNILEGLQGGVYVVDEGIKDGDMKLAGKGWKIVKKNITEISNMVQDILYSAKKRKPELQKTLPDEIVREAADLFRERASFMGISLKYEVNPVLPIVNLDPPSIRKMLNNLIGNALDTCKKDKTKKTHFVVVKADFYDKLHFMFEVEDNGAGMDEFVRKNLFKEFFSTKGSGGTGLGLLTVNKIVKEHGGKIEVLSSPGKGSTFRIILRF
ncbi:HAMP domain-containing sensor histidine kinase [Desulfococcaceae bacterium HSG8]|nr:HAMP domain-containing sensor histidine kinase [Desulfococcaceae bacterium HSG8]